MKTFTININPVKTLLAKNKVYTISDQSQLTYLYPTIEDDMGLEPTYIDNLSTTTLINGNIEIDSNGTTRLIFIPNGVLNSANFEYTLKDSLDRESTAIITITTI